jgi:mono/diheme cytochrome c family protein
MMRLMLSIPPALQVTVGAAGVLLSLTAFRPQAANTDQGLFTKAQAERGRTAYDAQCADCHGTKLEGGTSSPLAGDEFFASWSRPELTLDDFFYIVRKTMPKEAAGSLPRESYADIVAYILQQNGFPEGETELVPDPVKLKAVRLEKPTPRDTSAAALPSTR